jgi:hypothetical protein
LAGGPSAACQNPGALLAVMRAAEKPGVKSPMDKLMLKNIIDKKTFSLLKLLKVIG